MPVMVMCRDEARIIDDLPIFRNICHEEDSLFFFFFFFWRIFCLVETQVGNLLRDDLLACCVLLGPKTWAREGFASSIHTYAPH